jgi:hypothetical protein
MFRRKKKAATRWDEIRDTLFGDMPPESWPSSDSLDEPWGTFVRAREAVRSGRRDEAISALTGIAQATDLEPRHVLQAWHFLRQMDVAPPAGVGRSVLGVVVEVPIAEGLDIVAAYADHSARYYNHANAAAVWERPDDTLDDRIRDLLAAGQQVADRIGPWEGARPPAPVGGRVRINMVAPAGLFFGEGPFDAFSRDALAGPVIRAATTLMTELIRRTERPA